MPPTFRITRFSRSVILLVLYLRSVEYCATLTPLLAVWLLVLSARRLWTMLCSLLVARLLVARVTPSRARALACDDREPEPIGGYGSDQREVRNELAIESIEFIDRERERTNETNCWRRIAQKQSLSLLMYSGPVWNQQSLCFSICRRRILLGGEWWLVKAECTPLALFLYYCKKNWWVCTVWAGR